MAIPESRPPAHAQHLIIQVVYARPESIWRRELLMDAGSTVMDAVRASGFIDAFPDVSSKDLNVGIYGQQCDASRQLSDHDRVEIYRRLVFDPMESRRRRAKHRDRVR